MGLKFYTDHFLAARCPDIVVIVKRQKMVQIIDVAVPLDCNVSAKEIEKIEKYDLLMSLWKMKCEVIPLVIGSLDCITSMLEAYLRRLTINKFLLRTAILGSSYILHRYL